MNYVDACLHYCQENNIDEDSMAAFIKATKALGLHGKILNDAKKVNMVKK